MLDGTCASDMARTLTQAPATRPGIAAPGAVCDPAAVPCLFPPNWPHVPRWGVRGLWVLGVWIVLVILPSVPAVRIALSSPLLVDDGDARGTFAYVLAAGEPYEVERLRAAADLYHQHRASRVLLPVDPTPSHFNYAVGYGLHADEWSRAWLGFYGVPEADITMVEHADGALDTLAEAQGVRQVLGDIPGDLVLVSSPFHVRRARLAFERTMPGRTIRVFPANRPRNSPELFLPLWLEYLKLAVYWIWV